MKRKCLACRKRPAATEPDWPALCERCLDRAGDPAKPGDQVVCRVDEAGNGTVERIDGDLAIVRTNDGRDTWLPTPDLIRIA